MPLTGDAKREYQRVYQRQVRKTAAIAASVIAHAVKPSSGLPTQIPAEAHHAAQSVLQAILERQGLTVDRIVAKAREKLDATTKKTIARKATTLADNDAQLRAADLAIRLHERAGTIPAIQEQARGGTGLSVQINFVMPNRPQPVVIEGHAESHEHGSP